MLGMHTNLHASASVGCYHQRQVGPHHCTHTTHQKVRQYTLWPDMGQGRETATLHDPRTIMVFEESRLIL